MTTSAIVGCNAGADTEDIAVETRSGFAGEELFRGLVFLDGPVAERLPELRGSKAATGEMTAEQREELAGLADAGMDLAALEQAKRDHYEEFVAVQTEVIDWIAANDPEFFDRFAKEVQSGDHYRVTVAMDDALDMLKLSAWELHGIDVDDFTANDDPEQLFVGPLFTAVAVAVALVAAAYVYWAAALDTQYVWQYDSYWGGGDGGGGGCGKCGPPLRQDIAVDLIARRLVIDEPALRQ
jgi:SdpC family antimicrobial peptide